MPNTEFRHKIILTRSERVLGFGCPCGSFERAAPELLSLYNEQGHLPTFLPSLTSLNSC
jgi:hypothetical protein